MINTKSPKPHILMVRGQWAVYLPSGHRVIRTPWLSIALRAAAKAHAEQVAR